MELYLALVGIYFILWFLRFKTGARIWEMLTIGILVYFMMQFSTSVPLLVTFIGMILYTAYDGFKTEG